MNRTLKIITAVATLITCLGALVGAFFALINFSWILFATCMAFVVMFGLFLLNDYRYFFVNKTTVAPDTTKELK